MIVFSHELFSIQSYGGVTRCMIELMRALHAQGEPWLAWAGRHGSESLDQFRREAGLADQVLADPLGPLPGRLRTSTLNEWRFRRFMRAHPGAIVHRTQYPVKDLTRSRAKVSTLHDMWTERPGAASGERLRSRFKRAALESSDAIVCVSEHSRQAMLAIWPHLADRSVTIHHGVKPVSDNPEPAPAGRPFFLFVGSREDRKNFAILIEALAIAPRLKPFDLVCAGGGPFNDAERRLIAGHGLDSQVQQRKATDAQLAGLYAAATALVYPSIFEGFGMPALEAMIHDCPVILAPVSCMPEIADDAAAYAAHDDPEAWRDAMEHFAFDSAAAAAARALGHARARHFSWDASAARHRDVYSRLA